MIVDILNKKRLGMELSKVEMEDFFNGYLIGEVEDYQVSALLMAICINGMSNKEIFDLTDIFINSGDVLDLSDIEGKKVDKHSTGGVGDKTTLIIAPIVASLDIPVVKMSGRGLGFTGGTIDKLESIPGFRTMLTEEEIKKQVNDIGVVLCSQTRNLTPLDKKIYALRDVTATTESIPLIASSIMSKKIASGADKIVIDLKVGKGALIKTMEDAKELSNIMMAIGNHYNKEVRVIISNMDVPLGRAIGNAIEVEEAISILENKGDDYLRNICINLAANMVSMAKDISVEEAVNLVKEALETGHAYKKFIELIRYQGGDLSKLKLSESKKEIFSQTSGIVKSINALEMGKFSVSIGAGRDSKDEKIDHSVGIYLDKIIGEEVAEGEKLCTIYTDKEINSVKINSYYTLN